MLAVAWLFGASSPCLFETLLQGIHEIDDFGVFLLFLRLDHFMPFDLRANQGLHLLAIAILIILEIYVLAEPTANQRLGQLDFALQPGLVSRHMNDSFRLPDFRRIVE